MRQTRLKSHDPKPGDQPWLSSETTLDLWEPMEMVRQQVLWRIVNMSTEYPQIIPNLKVHSDFQLANSMFWSSIFWWTRHTRSWKLRAIRKNRKKRGIFFRRKKVADCDPTNRAKLDVSPRFMAITGDTNELFIGHGGYVIYLYIMVEECLMVKSDSTWKYCNIHGMWYIQ